MNIPGITDITPEEMAGMTLEQLEELRDLADSQSKEFQMQLESLEMAGGVSIAHATQFKGILPPQVVLESFTSQVTHTNYAVATESLKTAVKVAAVVGAVAAIGAIGFLVTKMMSRGDKADKQQEVAKRCITVYQTVFDQNDPATQEKIKEAVQKRMDQLVEEGVSRGELMAWAAMPALEACLQLSDENCRLVAGLDKFFEDGLGKDIEYISKHAGTEFKTQDLPSWDHKVAFSIDRLKMVGATHNLESSIDWEKKIGRKNTTADEVAKYLEDYEAVLRRKVEPSDLKGGTPLSKFYRDGEPPSGNFLGADMARAMTWLSFVGQIDEKLKKAQKSIADAQKSLDNIQGVPPGPMDYLRKNARSFEEVLRLINGLMTAADLEVREMLMGFKKFAQDMTIAYKELYDATQKLLGDKDLDPNIEAKLKKTVEAIRSDMAKVNFKGML